MIPRLQRFYGGDPERWLEIPVPVLAAYAEMYLRLDAEDRQARITDTGLGFGNVEETEAREVMATLARLTGRKARPADRGELAAMGIAIETSEPPER